MDIKLLLLKSITLKKPLSGSYRFYYKKSCFLIKYELKGKILKIKNIKRKKKSITWSQRIKFYKKLYRFYRRKKNNVFSLITEQNVEDEETKTLDNCKNTKDAQTETLKNPVAIKITSTQTTAFQKLTKEVETQTVNISPTIKEIIQIGSTNKLGSTKNQSVSFKSTAQQTIASVKFNYAFVSFKGLSRKTSKSCQTESNTECKGIQCKKSTQIKSSNTESNTRDSFAQVENDLFKLPQASEEEANLSTLPLKDLEILIYMLNEIGESVINQNMLLNSNTEVIKQTMQINLLKNSKRTKHPCRTISTQTTPLAIIEQKNSYSQTKTSKTLPRKLLLFKGRKSQHNN